MPKLILVRHGQTNFNAQQRYQGQTDNPLNEIGMAQAATLQSRLAEFKLDAVYVSDLLRARQTAQLALDGHPNPPQPVFLSALREAHGGEFEGLNWDQMVERFPEEVKLWQEDRVRYGPPGGETVAQVLERVEQAYNQILREQSGENRTVLIVAHGGVLAVLLSYLMGMDLNRLWQWRIDTCSLTLVDIYPEGAILSLFNDTAHLDPAHLERRQPNPAVGQTSDEAPLEASGEAV